MIFNLPCCENESCRKMAINEVIITKNREVISSRFEGYEWIEETEKYELCAYCIGATKDKYSENEKVEIEENEL